MTTCPDCNGKKGGNAFVCGPNVSGYRWVDCSVCKGTGQVDEAHSDRWHFGRRMWRERIQERRATLRTEATRLGVSVVEWSQIENGAEPKTNAGRAALARRKAELEAT
jgi:hypothetical protein